MKISVIGGNGRMGQAIIHSAQNQNITLHSVIIKKSSQYIGEKIVDTLISNDIKDIKGSDVILDFSDHISGKNNVEIAALYNIPILIGTTGDHQLSDYKDSGATIIWAPNTSISWNIIREAIEKVCENVQLSSTLGEVHHKNKIDNPSGTTKQLDSQINADQIWSLRAGDKMSMHQFMGLNSQEMIRFEHQVFDRQLYANDALVVAKWLRDKSGLFTMKDFLQSKIQT